MLVFGDNGPVVLLLLPQTLSTQLLLLLHQRTRQTWLKPVELWSLKSQAPKHFPANMAAVSPTFSEMKPKAPA